MTADSIDWASGAARDHIDEYRSFMWNDDYLDLLAGRVGLQPGLQIADVGCGHGHFGLGFLKHVLPGGTLDGYELEPALVAEASRRAAARGLDGTVSFRQGDVTALPAPDACYDVVLCQTVLMHLAEPERAVAEMLRVLKPGGRILAAEPDLIPASLMTYWETDGVVGVGEAHQRTTSEFFQRVVPARRARGGGDFRIGRRLPFLFRRAGLEKVSASLNDRINLLMPPYDQALLAWTKKEAEHVRNENFVDVFRGDHVAAGGDAESFATFRAAGADAAEARVAAAERGALDLIAGGALLVVIGVKPGEAAEVASKTVVP